MYHNMSFWMLLYVLKARAVVEHAVVSKSTPVEAGEQNL